METFWELKQQSPISRPPTTVKGTPLLSQLTVNQSPADAVMAICICSSDEFLLYHLRENLSEVNHNQ